MLPVNGLSFDDVPLLLVLIHEIRPPDPGAAALAISDASAAVQGNRAVLRFTRPLQGTGKLASVGFNGSTSILSRNADVIWAVGSYEDGDRRRSSSNKDNTAGESCGYHEGARGLRIVNWERPQSTFSNAWHC